VFDLERSPPDGALQYTKMVAYSKGYGWDSAIQKRDGARKSAFQSVFKPLARGPVGCFKTNRNQPTSVAFPVRNASTISI
jgi:hypothetical protein